MPASQSTAFDISTRYDDPVITRWRSSARLEYRATGLASIPSRANSSSKKATGKICSNMRTESLIWRYFWVAISRLDW